MSVVCLFQHLCVKCSPPTLAHILIILTVFIGLVYVGVFFSVSLSMLLHYFQNLFALQMQYLFSYHMNANTF